MTSPSCSLTAGETYLSNEVYSEPGVAEHLQERATVSAEEATLRGIREKMRVYRVTL